MAIQLVKLINEYGVFVAQEVSDTYDTAYRVIQILEDEHKFAADIECGQYLPATTDTITVALTKAELAQAIQALGVILANDENALWKVTGFLYGDRSYSDFGSSNLWPRYDIIAQQEWMLSPAMHNVHTPADATKWLLENHPDFYMGHTVVQMCYGGDFSMTPAPGIAYGIGNYESLEARYQYACDEAKSIGIVAGKSEILCSETY